MSRVPHLAHLMALLHRLSILSGREWDLPVLLSRPANTIGSMLPSSSGRATCTWGRVLLSTTVYAEATKCDRAHEHYLPSRMDMQLRCSFVVASFRRLGVVQVQWTFADKVGPAARS